jgi:hypothetical protein
MADKLLIRAYNVEVGDCVYCRIPKAHSADGVVDDFHILIDCGSVGGIDHLENAMSHLTGQLPETAEGKRRLDLLVATHEHKDHIIGFGLPVFEQLEIGQIWMNAAMNPQHPQAQNTLALRTVATTAMQRLESLHLSLAPEVQELVALFSVDNDDAMEALRTGLPDRNGIQARYVHAGMTGAEAGLPLVGASIRVLGPEQDIDHFYLGEDVDETLNGFRATSGRFGLSQSLMPEPPPANIGAADFRVLQSRMLSNALGFAELSSRVTNNSSVVLLIEWQGKRLLFVGDAEWDAKYREGKSNGAWNVMWHKRKAVLNKPIHFLKIGHHGSENSTPWSEEDDEDLAEPAKILDGILPLPTGNAKPKAKAIVSTMRKNYKTIPRSALLQELGRRVANSRNYEAEFAANEIDNNSLDNFREYEKEWFGVPQPWRTDCEHLLSGVDFVDVEIKA